MRYKWFLIGPMLGPMLCAAAPLLSVPLAEWAAVSPSAKNLSWLCVPFYILFIPAALVSFIALAAVGALPEIRKQAALVAICCGMYAIAFNHSTEVAHKVRMNAFHQLADRSRPLVESVRAFERKYGHPPHSLDVLVPEFIATVPATGIAGYPTYQYCIMATKG
jgi:hypothetical protein